MRQIQRGLQEHDMALYIIELEITNAFHIVVDISTGYFMDEIIASGIVRQLWVSRETQKRIIQASIKTMGLPLIALIDE